MVKDRGGAREGRQGDGSISTKKKKKKSYSSLLINLKTLEPKLIKI
jgi:hypothetical protein